MNQPRFRWAAGIAVLAMSFMDAPMIHAQPAENRVEQLLSQMTLEEKIALVHGDSRFATAGVPRLGIPRLWMSDGPQGVREEIEADGWRPAGRTDDFSTWLPANLCLAATFDPDLASAYGAVIGQEAKARGKHIMLGPSLNIQRTPLNGRNFEYLGEDPWLTSRMAVSYIRGEQGEGVASCVKHFAANNQETDRNTIDVEMDERALREIYLPAFRASVQEAGVLCVMGAYNKFRGQHCCENDYLLNKILKGEWGFRGMVISDWGGAHDTKKAAMNGLDLEMGTPGPYEEYFLANPLRDAVEKGEIPESVLDDKVRRHLRVMAAIGLLDGGAWGDGGSLNTHQHQATAREVEEEGMVLLKNEGNLLPLNSAKIGSVAVIGENAERRFAHGGGSAEIKAFYEIPGLQGIVRRAGANVNVTFSMGYSSRRNDEQMVARAVAAAKTADVAVIFAGLPHDWYYDTEGSDRRDLKLPFGQDELIRRVAEANPRTVVVLIDGGAVGMPWLDRVGAVVEVWYPGMEGGNAIAGALFGDVNPSGKLPCTFPKRLGDSPAHAMGNFPGKKGVERYDEGLLVGYRWFDAKDIEPLFPFGFGLSYTHFEYSNLLLFPQHGSPSNELVAKCTVANAGSCAGAEVVQLYVSQAHPGLPRPPKELKGFARIKLEAGESGVVWIPLDRSAFAYYDPARGWVAEKDDFTIEVGGSSRDIRLKKTWSRAETTVEK
ncbi:MAG: glycoside hydrolase family 3 C-terminal domain-containing protein [Tepidisphaeraceae bacterium]|jgi:beta-glucosidase